MDIFAASKMDLKNKIKEQKFTATSTTANIVHNLPFDVVHDSLQVFYNGLLLQETKEYVHNVNKIAVTFVDWTILTGETISFQLYKNVK